MVPHDEVVPTPITPTPTPQTLAWVAGVVFTRLDPPLLLTAL